MADKFVVECWDHWGSLGFLTEQGELVDRWDDKKVKVFTDRASAKYARAKNRTASVRDGWYTRNWSVRYRDFLNEEAHVKRGPDGNRRQPQQFPI